MGAAGPRRNAHDHITTMDVDEKPMSIDNKYNEQVEVAAYVPNPDEEKALVRRIDRRLLPVLWVMYIFNYIDRVSMTFAWTTAHWRAADLQTNIGVGRMAVSPVKSKLMRERMPELAEWRMISACPRPSTHWSSLFSLSYVYTSP
jgi:hypothetical protein